MSKEELKLQFFTAVANNDINVVQRLIAENDFIKNLLSLPEECDKLLTCAGIENNHPEMFETLLANMAIEGAFANNTLVHACKQGNYQIVNRLVQKNAVDVNYSLHGETPLDATIKNGSIEIVNLLIEKGAQVKLDGGYLRGESCWAIAAAHGQVTMLKHLLEKYPLDNHDLAILIEPIAKVNNPDIIQALVELLQDRGLDFKSQKRLRIDNYNYAQPCFNQTVGAISQSGNIHLFDVLFREDDISNLNRSYLLLSTSYEGHTDLAQHLLDFGLDPNTSMSINGTTALHMACCAGDFDMLQLLLSKGNCDVNAVNHDGETPLTYLAYVCPSAMVGMAKELVIAGANINHLNRVRCSALTTAITCINRRPISSTVDLIGFIEFIVGLKPDVNTVNDCGLTPLMYAVKDGHVEVVKLLLADCDIDHSITNKEGRTAAQMAEQASPEIAELFANIARPSPRP